MKTITSHILAWLALAVFCAVVSCTITETKPNGTIDTILYVGSRPDTLSTDTTDNDWIKDHSEIKNLDE